MRRIESWISLAVLLAGFGAPTSAQPAFINGFPIDGGALDRTGEAGANAGRLGFFSDIYYDWERDEWWALSDRGPGGGVLDYRTRVQRFDLKVNKRTGAISQFRVLETVLFRDRDGMLLDPTNPDVGKPNALNGLNPLVLNGDAGALGRSFDPEGLVIDPRTGHLLVADEYGPSVYEFKRNGNLVRVFETPANLIPKLGASVNYVADRSGLDAGRQDNRGFEGLAITPDGRTLYAVRQDPLVNELGPNNGRDGRNLRIVAFDNDPVSATYGESIAQYAYQLEAQALVRQRILDAGGVASLTDPRQGRNIGLSAIVALNQHEFLVLERDNRGIGVDDPAGAGVTGSKRVYRIDLEGATDVSAMALPGGDLAAAGIAPVTKSASVFIDLAADTVLPNGKKAEKWEGLAVGPRLSDGGILILPGTDNDYSVTQNASSVQFDVYVDFAGHSVQRDLDQPTMFNGIEVGPVPQGHVLVPGVLHAYKASAGDLEGYEPPQYVK